MRKPLCCCPLAAQGDTVEADQEIFEVETNKATMGVTTMCGGILSDVFIKEGESVVVGARIYHD